MARAAVGTLTTYPVSLATYADDGPISHAGTVDRLRGDYWKASAVGPWMSATICDFNKKAQGITSIRRLGQSGGVNGEGDAATYL
jgi:hypothetical protein